jgi:hypothetical protein
MPYAGYSGDKAGEFGFYFGQSRTLSTIIETWPEITIANATMTLYVIPEPTSACLVLISLGMIRFRNKKLKK